MSHAPDAPAEPPPADRLAALAAFAATHFASFDEGISETPTPLVVHDADAAPHWINRPAKQLVVTRSSVSVPILLGNGRVIGARCAHNRRVLGLGQNEVDAMRILARMVASQIERDAALLREADAARGLAAQNRELNDALHRLAEPETWPNCTKAAPSP